MDLVCFSQITCENVNCIQTVTGTVEMEDEEVIDLFLHLHKVLPTGRICRFCLTPMMLNRKKREYCCQKRLGERRLWGSYDTRRPVCNYTVSEFKGTFFEGAKLSKMTILRFVTFWNMWPHPRQHRFMCEFDMAASTVVNWSNYCREVCVVWLMDSCNQIGGEGHMVEIDEAKIGRRKYNRMIIEGSWMFGGIDRTTKETFLVPVPVRDAATLIPLIVKWVRPGSTIISDMWRACSGLPRQGLHHLTGNHSANFVDPVTRAHTKNIDRTWRDVRGRVSRYGNDKHHAVGHLAEYLFKRKFGEKTRLHYFWKAVGSVYPGIVEFPHYQEGPEDDDSDIASSEEDEVDD